jgi:Spy/CpxP family protein refolding chaperone
MDHPTKKTRGRIRWGRWIGIGLLATLLGAGVWGMKARAFSHGWHGPDAEHVQRHMQRRLERILERLDASEAQREQILGISEATRARLRELGGDRFELRGAFVEELSSDPIDRAELEALRAEQIARMDEASRILLTGLTEALEVLTPGQRAEIAEIHVERMRDFGRWHP